MKYGLVVSDSRVIRVIARRIFEELQFVTDEAEDGIAGLRACREKMPDLVFLDWALPGMSGLECVRGLRAQPNGARPFVLAAVTELDANEIALAVAAGVNDYVMKPFDRAALAVRLGIGQDHPAFA